MFRFANPEYLYLLIIVPVLWGLFLYGRYRSRRNLAKYGNPQVLAPLMPDVSKYKPWIKFILQQFAFIVLIFVLARPQSGAKLQTEKMHGIEVMIALDVSNSMLAEDISPNRLSKAKMMLSKLVDELDNDKIGLIVFAGQAYTQLPITTDVVSAKMFLNSIDPRIVPTQGTAIGDAISTAMNSFTPNEGVDRAIILITDAENHEDNAIDAAQAAAHKGIKVDVIGIGSPDGAPIPLGKGLIKDKEGNVVVSKLNEQLGRDIAQAGGGIYVRADNTNSALRALMGEVEKMKTVELEKKVYTDYNEQYQGLAWIALLLLLVDIFVIDRKNSWLQKINFFTTNA